MIRQDMQPALYLGIDGGGTATRARLTDDAGQVLGEAQVGSSNLTLGIERGGGVVIQAAEAALAAAGLPAGTRTRLHAGLGLAGANVPEFGEAIARYPFGFLSTGIASDAEIACLGAHGGADGAILILGTGSQGLVMHEGHSTAIGGWGFALSDDGSGAAIGRGAVRRAVRARDGLAPDTELSRAILAEFGADMSLAVVWAKTATPQDYARHAPATFAAAAAGDANGQAVIAEAVEAVACMLDRLVALGAQRITLVGGLARLYLPLLPGRLAPVLTAPRGDALAGALQLARRQADIVFAAGHSS